MLYHVTCAVVGRVRKALRRSVIGAHVVSSSGGRRYAFPFYVTQFSGTNTIIL